MNKYSKELSAEIAQDEGIKYDSELKDEMFEYIFFENCREQFVLVLGFRCGELVSGVLLLWVLILLKRGIVQVELGKVE